MFYQLHAAQQQLLRPLNNLEKRILQKWKLDDLKRLSDPLNNVKIDKGQVLMLNIELYVVVFVLPYMGMVAILVK